MDDLISRSALLAKIGNVRRVTEYDETGCGMEYSAIPEWAVMLAPAVDAVPVVRCKECIHAIKFRSGQVSCGYHDWCRVQVDPDGYCNHGEKDDIDNMIAQGGGDLIEDYLRGHENDEDRIRESQPCRADAEAGAGAGG